MQILHVALNLTTPLGGDTKGSYERRSQREPIPYTRSRLKGRLEALIRDGDRDLAEARPRDRAPA